MIFSNEKPYLLSIETIVNGGSLALFKGTELIKKWQGSREVSKAEDVLEEISRIFAEARINKTQIATIVVSKTEGNLTGGKIGFAIAKGLAKAFQGALIESSIFESILATTKNNLIGRVLVAIPIGDFRFGWKTFENGEQGVVDPTDNSNLSIPAQIESVVKEKNINKIIILTSSFSLINELKAEHNVEVIDNKNLAEINAKNFLDGNWV